MSDAKALLQFVSISGFVTIMKDYKSLIALCACQNEWFVLQQDLGTVFTKSYTLVNGKFTSINQE